MALILVWDDEPMRAALLQRGLLIGGRDIGVQRCSSTDDMCAALAAESVRAVAVAWPMAQRTPRSEWERVAAAAQVRAVPLVWIGPETNAAAAAQRTALGYAQQLTWPDDLQPLRIFWRDGDGV